ncbi:MAG: folate-binding protein YgfZ [Magnetococcales bacterium]|nr:folate-binding protein YgfZ [Magnetococcales bacterium]
MSLLKSHLPEVESWFLDAGEESPARFSTHDKELDNLTNHAALVDFSHRSMVEISGPQRHEFIQGLITNQAKEIRPNKTIYAAMLTPQGRFQWDFCIGSDSERLFLDGEPQQGEKLAQNLAFYLMRTKASIADVSEEYGVLAIVGPEGESQLQNLFPHITLADADLGATFQIEGGLVLWRDPRHADFGWRLRVNAADYPDIWKKLAKKIPPAGGLAWDHYRILKSLPRGGNELIPGKTLPLEAGLLELHGVNFQKGCYVGQETTARTHHRGTLKKRLFQVNLVGQGPFALQSPVLTDSGKEAGTLTSVTNQEGSNLALAVLRLSDVAARKKLTVSGTPVTVQKPHWAEWTLE